MKILSLILILVSSLLLNGAVPSTKDFNTNYFTYGLLPVSVVGNLTNWSKLGTNVVSGGGGGDTIWTNSGGVVTTIASTNSVLAFTSGAADNATNIAVAVGTASAWTGGKLLSVKNGDEQFLAINADSSVRITASTNSGYTEFSLFVGALSEFDVYTDPSDASLLLGPVFGKQTFLWPSASASSTPYSLYTSASHTSGNLLEVANNGTNKFTVDWTGSVTLAGTTNQVVFGGTNSAPSSSAAPSKWISVQVQGESTVYRLPLYQ